MKKFYLLTKTLLVMALLCVGASNAWAAATTIYERGVSTAWTSADVTKTANTKGAWYNSTGITTGSNLTGMMIDGTYGLRLAARNTTATATLTLDRTANTIVTIDAVWNVGSASADGNTPHTQFTYGDLMIQQNVRSNNLTTTYKINGVTKTVGTDKFARQDDMTIHLKVNSISGEISEFYLKNGETTVAQFSDLDNTNNTFAAGSNYDAVTMLAWISASSSYAWCALKSITVQQETQDVATANVTFKYEDTEGNSLSAYKPDQVAKDIAVDTEISSLISTYNATFYNGDDNKYVYNSYAVTGDYTTVQADGNTVTLKFTDYPATAYTVKAQAAGADVKILASGTAFLDGSNTVYWNKYVNVDDKWYVADDATYGVAITKANTNVPFTVTDAIDYLFEAENMTASRTYGTISKNTSYSGGAGSGIYLSSTLTTTTTISSGTYIISIGSVTRNTNKTQTYNISYSTDGSSYTDTGKSISFTTAAGSSEQSVIGVSIPADAYIRLTEGTGGNANDYIDYVSIKSLPSTVSATVTAAGYATYVPAYALDFSETSIKAYKVKVNTKGVATMTKVDEVPAGTPVLLYKEGGATENIPVIASADAVSDNDLVAGTGAAVATIDGDYTNMILNVVDEKVGFYFAAGNTVATNRAYLHIATTLAPDAVGGGEARGMRLEFAGNITGINEAAQATEAAQKDGKFVINGKLVIKKNGKMFNAAGAQMK